MNETKKVSRRKYTAEFKAKVALEAMQENQTLPELCSQFTSSGYVKLLEDNGISISMDSRGRALDDIYIERLWRSVKQEYVYKNPCRIFDFYNNRRPHQSLDYQCPATVYMKKRVA